jgi:DNA-binding MarR family transcriptional regulator/N-acetylglutamate synthase-like GNAT family acetyltransferase
MVDVEAGIAAVRRFSRFYTRRLGILREGLVGSAFTLTEARVVFELAQRGTATAADLGRDLGIDAGYLSRLLAGLDRRDLIVRRASETDGRQILLSLSDAGRSAFAEIDAGSRREVGALLAALSADGRARLVDALGTVEALLGEPAGAAPTILLRPPRSGDLGWVVERHGTLYAREHGWDASFEALVAGIVAEIGTRTLDPACERFWIAEIDGRRAGSVCVVRHEARTAKLRLLIVDPAARGLGLGRRLVGEAIAFARDTGYRRMTLWTFDELAAARAIYEAAGFARVSATPERSFGRDHVAEVWERDL